MPCFRTTPRLARKLAEEYEQAMREADFVGRVSRQAWMLPTWDLVPTEVPAFPVSYLWGRSGPHAGATIIPWGQKIDCPPSWESSKRIFQAMLRCKPLSPIVVESIGRAPGWPGWRPRRKWEVIDGHHRVSMAMILGITHVPAVISSEEYSR